MTAAIFLVMLSSCNAINKIETTQIDQDFQQNQQLEQTSLEQKPNCAELDAKECAANEKWCESVYERDEDVKGLKVFRYTGCKEK